MREIKFRAWDGEKFVTEDFYVANSKAHVEENDGGCDDPECCGGSNDYMADRDWVLQQFTGLHDKNRKEIYEGDIVRIGNVLIEVMNWVEQGNWMGDKQPMVGFISHATIYKQPVEIIGNIYENPELLK